MFARSRMTSAFNKLYLYLHSKHYDKHINKDDIIILSTSYYSTSKCL